MPPETKKPQNTDSLEYELTHETPMQRAGEKILHSAHFDHAMAIVISLNLVVVVMETDYNAVGSSSHGEATPAWMEWCSWFVLTVFVLELLARLAIMRRMFIHDVWNIFDFFVVVIDLVFSIVGIFLGAIFPVSAFRIFRLLRLARVSKIFRVFPELRLMVSGLLGAVKVIFWGTFLLVLAMVIFSVIAVQFIHPLNVQLEDRGVYADCERCPRAYSTVFHSVLTFSQIIVAGDSFGIVTLPIVEAYPWTALYFSAVLLVVGMAIMNLILGVIVNVADEARKNMQKTMDDEQIVARLETRNHLVSMCASMDADGSGEVTKAELSEACTSGGDFSKCLEDMDIGIEDLDVLWTILDSDRSGNVSVDEFVTQVYRMKSSDTQFLLAYIKFYVTDIRHRLQDDLNLLMQNINSKMHELDTEVEADLGRLESMEKNEEAQTQALEKEMEVVEEDLSGISKDISKLKQQGLPTVGTIAQATPNGQKIQPKIGETASDDALFRLLQIVDSKIDVCMMQSGAEIPVFPMSPLEGFSNGLLSRPVPEDQPPRFWPRACCSQEGPPVQRLVVEKNGTPPPPPPPDAVPRSKAVSSTIGVTK